MVSIGKLHFRGLPGDDHGFSEELLAMHVVEGIGDVKGLVRENIPRRNGYDKLAKLAGPGESPYTRYDRDIAARAQMWLHEEAPQQPRTALGAVRLLRLPALPADRAARVLLSLSARARSRCPSSTRRTSGREHPYLRDYDACVAYDAGFGGDPRKVRRAIAGYLGLVSFMDDNVGKVLRALEEAGLAADTRVVYTSDHGDNIGARGLWGKSTMYEESAGVPLILAGPDIAAGARCATPASHVDLFPFFLEASARRPVDGGHGRLAARACRRARSRTRGAERIPRDRIDRRHHHAAQGALEVRALRALPAAAFRPGGAIPTSWSTSPATRRTARRSPRLQAELRRFCDPDGGRRAREAPPGGAARAPRRPRSCARARRPQLHPAPGQAPDMN